MDLNSIMVVLILLSTSTSFLAEAATARHHPNLSPEYTKHNSHHSSKHHASSHGTSASSSRPVVPEPVPVHAQSKSAVEAAELQPAVTVGDATSAVDYDDYDEGDLLPRPGTYIPSNCSSCIRREELRKRNLEVIKDQILSKLGLMSAPNMTGRTLPKIPLHLELPHANMQGDAPYNQGFTPGAVYDDEDDDFHARTEKVIAFTQPAPDHVQAILKDVVYFKFTDKVLRSKVDKALLWIYLRPIDPSSIILTPENETWVTTYKVCIVKAGESPVISKVRSTRFQLSKHGGWVYLEVKKVVAEWFKHPEDNLGFILQVSDPKSFTFVREAVMEGDAAFMPFMEVTTTEGGKVRKKRTIGLNCNENSEETRCCRYPLTVDFEEFGWDWIIAPKRYEANYCSGECPYVFLQKYPHTHIVQQANPAGTAGPCCAPRRMSPISMLYFDHEYNIIYGVLPGMVVDRCGCS